MLHKLHPGQIEIAHVAFDLDEGAIFADVVAALLERIKVRFTVWTRVGSLGTASHQMLEQVSDRNLLLFLDFGTINQILFSLTGMVNHIFIQLFEDLLAGEWLHFELKLFVSALRMGTPSFLIGFLDIEFDADDALLADDRQASLTLLE